MHSRRTTKLSGRALRKLDPGNNRHGGVRYSAWFPMLRGTRARVPGTVVVVYTAFGV